VCETVNQHHGLHYAYYHHSRDAECSSEMLLQPSSRDFHIARGWLAAIAGSHLQSRVPGVVLLQHWLQPLQGLSSFVLVTLLSF
jgi:hypothetical protein